MRLLRVAVPVLVAAVLAALGTVVNYLLLVNNVSLSRTFQLLIGGRIQPFPGRFLGRGLQGQDVVAWLIGLVVLVVVLGGFVAVAGRSGRVAAFLGGWLGTIVGGAAAGLVGGLVELARVFPDGVDVPDVRLQYVLTAFSGGLYWSFFVGVVVGLVAMLTAGRPRERVVTRADDPAAPPPAAPVR